MVRMLITILFIFFMFAETCLADEIKGAVGVIDKSKKTLQISGITIQTANAWIENEQDYPLTLNDIMLGDYVEVNGKFIGSSEIKARKIGRKKLECGVVEGKIESVDSKKRIIVISGITIKVPAITWLEGPNHVKIPLELFAPGYKLKCKGNWTGTSELTAFKVAVD